MSKREHGFMLIELMFYSSLLITALVMALSYVAQSQVHLACKNQRVSLQSHMTMVLDRLVDDLTLAPSCIDSWKLITPAEHIWYDGMQDRGWRNTREGIIRSQGIYNSIMQQWNARTISYFNPGLSYTIELSSDTNNQATMIRVILSALEKDISIIRYVSLMQGHIL